MIRLFAALALAFTSLAGFALAQPGAPRIVPPATAPKEASAESMARLVLDRDFQTFLQWFEGRFDNELQVFFQPDLKTPEEAKVNRIHSIFKRVSLPAFGETVFYVEQYGDGDPTKIYRQRLYVFTPDYAEGAIKLVIHAPKNAAPLAGAWKDPTKLASLTPRDTQVYPGCDVWWKRQENQFRGYMRENACRIQSRSGRGTIIVTDDLVLTQDQIWIRDRAVDEKGGYVYGNKAGTYHQLRRIMPYQCWVAVLRGAKHGDSGQGSDNWQFIRDVWIHDQGGIASVTTDETPVRTVRLRLRDVEWPFGTNRPSLTLYVLGEEGSDRAVSYAWGEGGAERLGINLRWLQASCTAAPEKLWAGQ
jgi:hypothetical protein